MPNLTQKWKKQERISQLQVAYSILQNATKLAVAEHGDASTWDFKREKDEEAGLSSSQNSAKTYAEKYFIPYVKTKDKGAFKEALKDSHGYEIHTTDGSVENYIAHTRTSYSIILDNSMLVHIKASTSDTYGVIFYVDINGFQGPNMYGNDIFTFAYTLSNNNFVPFRIEKDNPDNDCSINNNNALFKGLYCAHRILNNSWQIPDDYPIKKF